MHEGRGFISSYLVLSGSMTVLGTVDFDKWMGGCMDAQVDK